MSLKATSFKKFNVTVARDDGAENGFGNACGLIAIEGGTHGRSGWKKLDPAYKAKLRVWLFEKLASRR